VRHEPGGGLGIVADEDNVVVDMVPGSPADLQRTRESKGDPRLQLGDKIIKIDTLDVPRMMQDDAMKGSGGASSYCATELASALLVLLPSCFALILRTLEVTEFLTTPTGRVWFAGGGCG
ncbi:MAG: hypothetical protein ACPIOQ_00120, partial [Promethearchaeia archaeon]